MLELDRDKVTSELMLKLIIITNQDKDFMLKEDSYCTNLVQDIAQSLFTISEIASTTHDLKKQNPYARSQGTK